MKKVLSIAIVAMLILFLLLSTVSCAGKTVSMSEAASGSATERNDVVLYADTIQTVQDTVQKVLDQETSAVTVAIMVKQHSRCDILITYVFHLELWQIVGYGCVQVKFTPIGKLQCRHHSKQFTDRTHVESRSRVNSLLAG